MHSNRVIYLVETSFLKTIRFNLHYFGLSGLKLPVLVAKNVKLSSLRGGVSLGLNKTGAVRIGYSGVGIFDTRYDRAIWQVSGHVHFDGSAIVGHGSKISVGEKGELSFGDGFIATAKAEFICSESISFGRGCLVSWDTLLMDTDAHCIFGSVMTGPIHLGDRVWIGCRCLLLKGANLPAGSVVAAGSVVSRRFEGSPILVGGVNKQIKHIEGWEL